MKTISFEEAKPGDWLVSDGGSVRVKVIGNTYGDIFYEGQFAPRDRMAYEFAERFNFHVEREDPPRPMTRLSPRLREGR